MANNIQFKRGLKENLPTSAPSGTPLWCTDTEELYIGTDSGTVKVGATNSSDSSSSTSVDLSAYEKIAKPFYTIEGLEPTVSEDDILSGKAIIVEDEDFVWRTTTEFNLVDNAVNRVTISSTSTMVLPSITNKTVFHQILVQLTMETVSTVYLGTSVYFDQQTPSMGTIGSYDLLYEYDGSNWAVGCLKKG